MREWMLDEENDFTCQFCNETYAFYDSDFEAALQIIKQGNPIDVKDNQQLKSLGEIEEATQEELEIINGSSNSTKSN